MALSDSITEKRGVWRALMEHRVLLTLWSRLVGRPVSEEVFPRFWNRVDKAISLPFLRLSSRLTPIDPGVIVFITSRGDYDCNPKWICEELVRQGVPYTMYWTCRGGSDLTGLPPSVIPVLRNSLEFRAAIAKARLIVDNSVSAAFMLHRKKRGQILMETWHGAIGIKRFSRDTNHDRHWVLRAEQEGRQTDYCISNSRFETELYRDTFWPHCPILPYGHARNDILFARDPALLGRIRERIFSRYRLPSEARICLYAPTFRDNGDLSPYQLPYADILSALRTRFGGEWVILTRYHFKVIELLAGLPLPESVINVSDYPDIQELLTCTDLGITDYSSWICEYMLTGRPGLLFTPDADDFAAEERSFFYPLSSLPYPLAGTAEELTENIRTFDEARCRADSAAFLHKYGCVDDGHAAERIAETIRVIMTPSDCPAAQ